MLAVLISWILGTTIFIALGKLIIQLFSFLKLDSNYNLSDSFFLGICFSGVILSSISILFPLNGLLILSVGFVLSASYLIMTLTKNDLQVFFKKLAKLPRLSKILLVLFICVCLLFSVLPPLNFDTALYHLQSMMWAESYPVIPGLGNIHSRFGFNPNSLLLHSTFSLKDIFPIRIYGLHSLSLIILYSWIIYKVTYLKNVAQQISIVLLSIAFFICYEYSISSPSTDELPNIIVVYIFLRLILNQNSLKESPLLFTIIPVFCCTLKLSVAPICLFTLASLFFIIKEKNYKAFSVLVITCFFVIIPWCIRNIMISGYLIYPFPAIDIFNVDWKLPYESAKFEKDSIKWFARFGDRFLEYPSFEVWIRSWIMKHFISVKSNLAIIGLAFLSPLIIFLGYKLKHIKKTYSIYIWFVAFLGTLFWAIMGPDERFGFGLIVVTALSPFMFFNIELKKAYLQKAPLFLLLLFFMYSLNVSFKLINRTKWNRTYSSFLYQPQSIDFVKSYAAADGFTTERIDSITIYIPVNSIRCFDQGLPCTPYFSNNIEMRGQSIRDGFRLKK